MDIDSYLDKEFHSRAYAEKAVNDFVTLLRRFRKFDRGTSECHVIYNMVCGIENTFSREFIDHMLHTRFNRDHRMKYQSCRVLKENNKKIEHDVAFRKRLEAEILRNKGK